MKFTKTNQEISTLRRSAAQVMAAAVLDIFPNVLLFGGRDIPDGFFYNFYFPFAFQSEFLVLIEERMRRIVKEKRAIQMIEMMPNNAGALLDHCAQPLRAEEVRQYAQSTIPMFRMNEWVDHCNPPYLSNSEEIESFKICEFTEEIHEKHGRFIRLYGTASFDPADLKKLIKTKKSFIVTDHVKIGKALNLFSACPEVGPGYWRWHREGESLRRNLLRIWIEQLESLGFEFVSTPRKFLNSQGECPIVEMTSSHIQAVAADISKNNVQPIRIAECSYVKMTSPNFYLCGMLSSSGFFKDQEHIFCSEDRLLKECISSLQFILKMLKILSFDQYRMVLCVGKVNKTKTLRNWKQCENLLVQALQVLKLDYSKEEKIETLNGPRLEIVIDDSLGRGWTTSFLGFDCLQTLHSKVIVQSVFSSIERVVALMLEKNDGLIPFSLAPEQIRIVTISGKQAKYAENLSSTLQSLGLRVWLDNENDKLSKKMYTASCRRIPYVVVVGEKEEQSGLFSVRKYNSSQTESINLQSLIQKFTCLHNNGKTEFENQ